MVGMMSEEGGWGHNRFWSGNTLSLMIVLIWLTTWVSLFLCLTEKFPYQEPMWEHFQWPGIGCWHRSSSVFWEAADLSFMNVVCIRLKGEFIVNDFSHIFKVSDLFHSLARHDSLLEDKTYTYILSNSPYEYSLGNRPYSYFPGNWMWTQWTTGVS